ncbi:MAG: ABC transporter permease [Deltaproteobacteria bacterium]|nr:ABC transporter permease [Deltaproteobacteria bacterium]
MGFIDTTRMLVLLAFRNLFSHRVKTAIVGMIMLFGTLLVVMGTALVDSIERAMEQSITASLAGHLQVYSAKGKDQLALFGGGFMGADDIGRIDDFSKVQDALSKVANVEAVVPMGLEGATVTAPGELEGALERLRVAVRANDKAPLATLQAQIKELLQQMKEERKVSLTITTDTKDLNEQIAKLDEGLSDALWARFEEDPLAVLEFLDTQVAPLAEEGRLMYFRYLGTDVDLFVQHFDRFEVVKGERIPPHTRGFMFSERFYERVVKHRIARYMDRVNESLHEEDLTIADDAGLQSLIRRSARQHRYITYQLDAKESAQLTDELKALLPEVQGGLPELLAEFLTVTDENFDARYAWFYAHVAPMLEMYAIDVGDTMTVRSYTKSGFLKALNIKLFGVYRFKGLESSDLASGTNLMDMLTFRELYGLMTDAKKAELSAIKDEVGLKDVAAEDAEAAFFGEGAGEVVARVDAEGFDEFADVKLARTETVAVDRTFTQSEVDHGMALNAAVVLKDRTRIKASMIEVEQALKDAGLDMKVVDWRTASGLVGQFVLLIRAVLYIAIFIIFVVALVIINNSMVMATMERTTEIGTMRAIGAQRRLVLNMFMLETMMLGVLAGAVGAGLGAGLTTWLGAVGLPAPNRQLIFLFGGPRLFPEVGASNLVAGLVVIIVVSLISTLYPAFIATRISPVAAMRTEE